MMESRTTSGPSPSGTLGEGETIARLATGIRRFGLPDQFNPIKIYRTVADGEKSPEGEYALIILASIFEDRRQYPRAAGLLRELVQKYGSGEQDSNTKSLERIVGNWGQFGIGGVQPAGKAPTVDFRFRNGKKVHFDARSILVPKLLADAKAYLKSVPDGGPLDGERLSLDDLGHRLVTEDEKQYVGAEAAAWDLDLDPRPAHLDRHVTVEVPLKEAGAYLLTARIEGGNTCKTIVWVADTAIVSKPTSRGAYYFVADAVTGRPVARANVEFFGYKREPVGPGEKASRTVTANFAELTDAEGQVMPSAEDLKGDFQWMVIARTEGGRLAFLGFNGVGNQPFDLGTYDRRKVFLATDRPVYRPGQAVKYKFWARQARYDEADDNRFAGKPFRVKVNNPNGETVFERDAVTDAFGGIDGEYTPPVDATLGAYALFLDGLGGGSFRVEEYKKPEFEVAVDAPAEPVRLGEKVEATIKAKYYFGAPVTEARVSYKVMRTAEVHSWFPRGEWDWLYGPGYGWLGRAYPRYPGWNSWGSKSAQHHWWGGIPRSFPEVVARGRGADRPRWDVEGLLRHGRGQGRPRRRGPQVRDHGGSRGRLAPDDRRLGEGAGGPQALRGQRLARPRLLSRRAGHQGELLGPHARRQADQGQGEADTPPHPLRRRRQAGRGAGRDLGPRHRRPGARDAPAQGGRGRAISALLPPHRL